MRERTPTSFRWSSGCAEPRTNRSTPHLGARTLSTARQTDDAVMPRALWCLRRCTAADLRSVRSDQRTLLHSSAATSRWPATDARSPSARKSGDESTGEPHEGFPCRSGCSSGSWAETSSRCGGGCRHRRSTPTPLTPGESCRPHTPWTNGCRSEQARLGTRIREGGSERCRAAPDTRTAGPLAAV